jgi:hypothetical protein
VFTSTSVDDLGAAFKALAEAFPSSISKKVISKEVGALAARTTLRSFAPKKTQSTHGGIG